MQGVEGSTPTGGTCRNDFSDPIDQDIRTQWALSWKIVVSEWRLVIAVSLNVGGGVRLIKPAKLCMCTQNTTNTTRMDAQCRVCAAMVPYRWATRGMSLRELEYTHTVYSGLILQIIISLSSWSSAIFIVMWHRIEEEEKRFLKCSIQYFSRRHTHDLLFHTLLLYCKLRLV